MGSSPLTPKGSLCGEGKSEETTTKPVVSNKGGQGLAPKT